MTSFREFKEKRIKVLAGVLFVTFILGMLFLALAFLSPALTQSGDNISQNYPVYRLTFGPSPTTNPIKIVGARGEHFMLLFEVLPTKDCSLSVSLSNKSGARLGMQAYSIPLLPGGTLNKKLYDVLIPIKEGSLGQEKSNRVAVVLAIPNNYPVGSHSCDLVFQAGGRETRQPLSIQVWQFTLPADLPVTVLGDFWPNREWFSRYGIRDEEAFTRTIATYLYFLRTYKINAIGNFYPLPLVALARGRPLTDFPSYLRLLDKTMELGYRYFRLPTLPGAKQVGTAGNSFERYAVPYFTHWRNFLKDRGLTGKALVQVWDEPRPNEYQRAAQAYSLVKSVAPELTTDSTGWAPDPSLAKIINIWAVYNLNFDQKKVTTARQLGQEIWLYANNLHGINKPNVYQRLVGWYLFSSECSGYLLWSVNYWPHDPWTNPPGDGDFWRRGTLLYPHPSTGLPLPTLRLEAMRRGWEDYQYLTLFKEAAQRGKVDRAAYDRIRGQVLAIAGNLKNNDPDVSWQEIENLRIQIGEMLHRAAGAEH